MVRCSGIRSVITVYHTGIIPARAGILADGAGIDKVHSETGSVDTPDCSTLMQCTYSYFYL